MAITMTCPRCMHKNTIDDAKAKQPVHCRICHYLFSPSSDGVNSAAPNAPETAAGLVMEGPPPAPVPRPADDCDLFPSKPTAVETRSDPPRRPPADRRDDDDDATQRSRRQERTGSASIFIGLLGVAGLLMLLGCCVGTPAVYLLFRTAARDEPIAVVVPPPPIAPPPNIPAPFNPPPFNPPPFNPPIFVPPAPPPALRLDAKNPDDMKVVLQNLQNRGPDLKEAIRWLKEADTGHPERDHAAKLMEGMVEEQKRVMWSNQDFFAAYFRWATKDNYPSLAAMVQDGAFNPDANHRRQKAMETLAALKDERAVEAIVCRLAAFHDNATAYRALESMGSAAEKTLIKHMNDVKPEIRRDARKLLIAQGDNSDAMLTQTLADLANGDDKLRDAALDWLVQAPIDDKRRAEVSRILDPLINPKALTGPLFKALETWGTVDNGQTIADNLGGGPFAIPKQIKLLGKLKDPRTLPVLASRIGKFGGEGNEAREAVKNFGTAAEPEIVKLLMAKEAKVRVEACRLMAFVGTPEVGVPALEAALQANPKDRQMDLAGKASIAAIKAKAPQGSHCTDEAKSDAAAVDYRIVFRYRANGPASIKDYESEVSVYERQKDGSEKRVGMFAGSIFPDDMKTRGRLKDGQYDLYLGLHRRSKDGKALTPSKADLAVKSQGWLRPALIVNADGAVPVDSLNPDKKTSTYIHVHNGFRDRRSSEGCLTLTPDDWPRFIAIFLDRYRDLADWHADGKYYGRKVAVLEVQGR